MLILFAGLSFDRDSLPTEPELGEGETTVTSARFVVAERADGSKTLDVVEGALEQRNPSASGVSLSVGLGGHAPAPAALNVPSESISQSKHSRSGCRFPAHSTPCA